MELSEAYSAVRGKIAQAAGAHPVQLIAVSKTQPTEKISALYALGHRDFGENYVQELEKKAIVLAVTCPEIRWHFIGHLQSNKVKTLLPWIASIHSIHSLSLAREIAKRWKESGRPGELPVFLEVNIDGEPSKSGLSLAEVVETSAAVSRLPGLCLEGLMCIPSPGVSDAFGRLRELESACRPFTRGRLSMGMSGDFEEAIRAGATHIRVGTLLFGERAKPA